jgi:hypothetical protein
MLLQFTILEICHQDTSFPYLSPPAVYSLYFSVWTCLPLSQSIYYPVRWTLPNRSRPFLASFSTLSLGRIPTRHSFFTPPPAVTLGARRPPPPGFLTPAAPTPPAATPCEDPAPPDPRDNPAPLSPNDPTPATCLFGALRWPVMLVDARRSAEPSMPLAPVPSPGRRPTVAPRPPCLLWLLQFEMIMDCLLVPQMEMCLNFECLCRFHGPEKELRM